MGPALSACLRVARSGRQAAARRNALHALRKGCIHLHRLLLVSAVAGGRAWGLPHFRQHAERRKGSASVSGEQDEPPPIFGTWRRVYTMVLLFLAGLIVAFYA